MTVERWINIYTSTKDSDLITLFESESEARRNVIAKGCYLKTIKISWEQQQ